MPIAQYEPKEGYTPLIGPGEMRYIEFGILKLGKGGAYSQPADGMERALIVLSGMCSVKCPGRQWDNVGERPNVFAGRAYAVYLPPQTPCEVSSADGVEVAFCSTKASIQAEPVLVTPADVATASRGTSLWRRDIHDIITPRIMAERLVVGETFNPPGKWSSYPPHKHDEDLWPIETVQEEVYLFRLQPEGGFGLQRLYTHDGKTDDAVVIKHNTVASIERGYHPVVGAPGYKLYYLWMLAGQRRELRPHDDPAHAWVHASGAMLDEDKR